MNCSHIILQSFSIIDAIRCINEIHNEPLVLFVVDENKRMQGTLTDGDVRRALIKGIDVDAPISEAMHRNFNFTDYPFMHLLYSQLLVCQRVCLQNTVCLICK